MSNNQSIKLEEETGNFLVCSYGSGIALGFRGDAEFIIRCSNFVRNFGLSSKKLSSLGFGLIYYVCTDYARLTKSLMEYYRGQVILRKMVQPISFEEIEGIKFPDYNEFEIEGKAAELSKNFIDKCLVHTNFMATLGGIEANEFRVAA